MRRVRESALTGDPADRVAGVEQRPARVLQAHGAPHLHRGEFRMRPEGAAELARGQVQGAGEVADGALAGQVLAHEPRRRLHPLVAAVLEVAEGMARDMKGRAVLVDDQVGEAFRRPRPAAVAGHDVHREVDRRGPAGAGRDLAVDLVDLVDRDLRRGEPPPELGCVAEVHRAATAVEEARGPQGEAAGAEARDQPSGVVRPPEEREGFGGELSGCRERAAHHDDAVEAGWIAEPRLRRHLDAAAGEHRVQRRRDDLPRAVDLAAPVRLVGGVAEHVQEPREGHQRELRQENEADPQVGFGRGSVGCDGGWGIGAVHGRFVMRIAAGGRGFREQSEVAARCGRLLAAEMAATMRSRAP